MAISNREKDASEKKETSMVNIRGTVTGASYVCYIAPFPCELSAVRIAAQGLSGAPTYNLERWSFVTGAGFTAFSNLGATLTVAGYGTSGAQGFSIVAAGSTLIQFGAGDLLVLNSGAANAATAETTIAVVVKALQDIKSHFGVST